MAPPRKKKSLPSSSSSSPLPCIIPEHVIFSKILPFLSADELTKLKRVCKSWRSFITSNPMLPLHRFRSSSYYSGVLFPNCDSDGQLVFLPTSTSSTPKNLLLNVNFSEQPRFPPCERLITSTNGLLCLKCRGNDSIVYVCNPSTKEGHVVRFSNSWPDDNDDKFRVTWRASLGLAYDPYCSKSKSSSYKLVCPRSQYEEEKKKGRMVFGFEVFSSQTNEWEKSLCECYMEEPHELADCYYLFGPPDKMMMCSTYAGGVLYWNCSFHLLRFDPEKGYGGTVLFPFHPFKYETDDYEIGECEGHLTLSRVSPVEGMQLWILQQDDSSSGGYYWELMHRVSFETVMDTNPYVFRSYFHLNEMLLRKKNRSEEEVEMMEQGFEATHLPYGGGERLFMTVPLDRVVRTQEENVLCYDANSGKLNKFCTLSLRNQDYFHKPYFLYRSSMLSLPKLGRKP